MLSPSILTIVLAVLSEDPVAAIPTAPARSIVVIDATDLPEKLPNAHERIRQAVEGAAAGAGWDVRPMPESSCDECFEQTATAAGVGTILRVTGRKTSMSGYDIAIELWNAAGASRRTTGVCNRCLFEEMTNIAARLTRELLASGEVPPQPSVALAPAAPIATAVESPPPQPRPPSPQIQLLVPVLVGGVGLVAVAAGISLWALDGRTRGTCTQLTTLTTNCDVYATKTIGQVITGVGAAGLVTGAVLLYRAFSASDDRMGVSVGPGAVALAGRF